MEANYKYFPAENKVNNVQTSHFFVENTTNCEFCLQLKKILPRLMILVQLSNNSKPQQAGN